MLFLSLLNAMQSQVSFIQVKCKILNKRWWICPNWAIVRAWATEYTNDMQCRIPFYYFCQITFGVVPKYSSSQMNRKGEKLVESLVSNILVGNILWNKVWHFISLELPKFYYLFTIIKVSGRTEQVTLEN